LLLAVLAGAEAGCVTLPVGWQTAQAEKPPAPVAPPTPPSVRPNQVTDQNARQMAARLEDELEWELNAPAEQASPVEKK
jgi:hypothetical protein